MRLVDANEKLPAERSEQLCPSPGFRVTSSAELGQDPLQHFVVEVLCFPEVYFEGQGMNHSRNGFEPFKKRKLIRVAKETLHDSLKSLPQRVGEAGGVEFDIGSFCLIAQGCDSFGINLIGFHCAPEVRVQDEFCRRMKDPWQRAAQVFEKAHQRRVMFINLAVGRFCFGKRLIEDQVQNLSLLIAEERFQ